MGFVRLFLVIPDYLNMAFHIAHYLIKTDPQIRLAAGLFTKWRPAISLLDNHVCIISIGH